MYTPSVNNATTKWYCHKYSSKVKMRGTYCNSSIWKDLFIPSRLAMDLSASQVLTKMVRGMTKLPYEKLWTCQNLIRVKGDPIITCKWKLFGIHLYVTTLYDILILFTPVPFSFWTMTLPSKSTTFSPDQHNFEQMALYTNDKHQQK